MSASPHLAYLDDVLARWKVHRKFWQKLIETEFVEPASKLPGTKRYGVPTSVEDKLRKISRVKRTLPGRFTFSRLAYEMALQGCDDVPLPMLKKELRKRLKGFFGWARRTLQRWAGLKLTGKGASEGDVIKAADQLARLTTKRFSPNKRARYHTYHRLLVGMLLRMMCLGANVRSSGRDFREMIRPYVAVETIAGRIFSMSYTQTNTFSDRLLHMVADTKDLLILDPKKNHLIQRLQTIPEGVLQRLLPLWRALTKMFLRRLAEAQKVFGFADVDSSIIDFIPVFTLAVLSTTFEGHDQDEFSLALRAGSIEKLDDLLGKILQGFRIVVGARKAVLGDDRLR